MSGLIVVGDSAVHDILIGQTRDETLAFQAALGDALVSLSSANEGKYQPVPGVVNRPTGQKVLFRAFTSAAAVGTKTIVSPVAETDPATGAKAAAPLRGMLSLCDINGLPRGVVNAADVTGYRTSLCALIPFTWRRTVRSVVVYGSGKQALWHIRLALALRGDEIDTIHVVNRSAETANSMIDRIRGENEVHWKSKATLTYVDPSQPGGGGSLAPILGSADVIFCTVPSTEPLFRLGDVLGSAGERQREPLITAIGAWQPQMIELDPDITRHAARVSAAAVGDDSFRGAVVVDDRHECKENTGDIIQSGLGSDQLIELGDILDWLREEPVTQRALSPEKLAAWTGEGFLVYKSIGVSVTDLVSGNKIVDLAREKNLGTLIPDF